jgi:hypothetical protein
LFNALPSPYQYTPHLLVGTTTEADMANKKFGNIRVLASGKVQARYYLPTGEQVAAGTFDTAHQAQNRLDEIEVDLRRGSHWDGRKGKTKFRDFITEYMEHRQKIAPI